MAQWQRIYLQYRRHGFDPWVRKIPWRRKWQSTPIFLPGKFHGQRSLVGYRLWGHERVGHDLATKQQNENMKMIYCNFKREIERMTMLVTCLKLHGLLSGTMTKAETNSIRV